MSNSCEIGARSRTGGRPGRRRGPASIAAAAGRGNRGRAAALLVLALAAAPAASASPGADARSLVGTAKALEFSVSSSKGEEGILLRARYETAARAGLDATIATLWDFAGSPEVFSRIDSVRVLADDGREAVTEQTTGIRVLGLTYLSVARFRCRLERISAREARVSFEAIWSDGSVLSTFGSWELREEPSAEGPLTRIVYSLESRSAATVVGQELIMRSFGGADIARTVKELAKAVEARARAR